MSGPPDASPSYERLSALDAAFLDIEDARDPMHIAATAVYGPGRLVDDGGRVDLAEIRRYGEVVLEGLPRWRRRVEWVPLLRHPVLVDDAGFDVRRHIRAVHLRTGTTEELFRVSGELYSMPLARDRPLWEQWIIDGLEGRRFATVTKVHHCLVDGVAGIGALAAMLRTTPDDTFPDPPARERRPAPGPRQLLRDEIRHRASAPHEVWSELRRVARRRKAGTTSPLRDVVTGLGATLRGAVRPAPKTIFNPSHIGGHRSFDGLQLPLADVKAVRRAVDGKVNDVVLATVAGALRRFVRTHHEDLHHRDLRCAVPVSLHERAAGDTSGNQVSMMLVDLPVDERDPGARIRRIVETTRAAKDGGQSFVLNVGEALAEWTMPSVLGPSARAAMLGRPFNVIVTNVPGPQFPLYLLGSPLEAVYPLVPLFQNQGIGIALLSYDGSLFWGLNADPDAVPDHAFLVECLRESFEELRRTFLE